MDSNINKNISPKKGRFNFVDVLILLAVLSLAALFVYIFDKARRRLCKNEERLHSEEQYFFALRVYTQFLSFLAGG